MHALTSCCGLAAVTNNNNDDNNASTFSPSHSSSSSSLNNINNNKNRLCMASSVRIAIVGDVHDEWDFQEDSKALHFLQPDLVLFTGDFGNENVELVSSIAKLEITKAVILGNHDCWSTSQFSGKKKDRVQLQLESLGEEHVGYRRMDFPKLNLSIVGGRPFSHGGDKLFRERLLSARYGVRDMEGSAKKIYSAAVRTPEGHSVVLLAHNGPTGSKRNDICGRDWADGGGDHGDPDLAQAILDLKKNSLLRVPLVVFGHMHKELAYGKGVRKMIVVGEDDTIYLNGAIVPRVERLSCEQKTSSERFTDEIPSASSADSNGTVRAFTVVEMLDGKVDKIAESWVLVIGDETRLKEEHILFKNGI